MRMLFALANDWLEDQTTFLLHWNPCFAFSLPEPNVHQLNDRIRCMPTSASITHLLTKIDKF